MIIIIHLRVHNHYSVKRGYGTPEQFLVRAAEMKMEYLGITNYANDFAFPYIWMKAKELANRSEKDGGPLYIKPLYGVEFYITSDMTRKGRPDFEDVNMGNDTIIMYAKNYDGYCQLLKMLSDANEPENYFTVGRIDYEYLAEQDVSNISCIIPYDFSTISKLIESRDAKKALEMANLLKDIFGEDLYLEITSNVSKRNSLINNTFIQLAERLNIKMLASSNVHYPNQEDRKVHDVLLSMHEKKTFADKTLYSLGSGDHYLRGRDSVSLGLRMNEVKEELIERLIDNTNEFAVNHYFDLKFAPMSLPETDIILPEEYKGNQVKYFQDEIQKGWDELIVPRIDSGNWNEIKSEDIPIYEKRMAYEYEMIKNIFTLKDPDSPMKDGFIDYFIIVADYIKWAKGIDRRIMHDAPIIPVGPARGSVSGSIIGYLTRMSTIDPIPWGLTFERFINPERISWPDIDMDFSPETAFWVELYLIETYGKDHVAHILTYQTAAGKKAFEYVSKALSGKYGKYKTELKKENIIDAQGEKRLLDMDNRKAREIQDLIDSSRKLKDQLTEGSTDPDGNDLFNPQLYEVSQLSAYKEMFELMLKIEGAITSTGSHPGAVIITREPLWKYTSKVNAGKYPNDAPLLTTSYEKYALEEVNTMKFDILRLNELVIVDNTLKFIKESLGIDIDLDNVNPFDRESNLKILALMKNGDLDGIFQFSSHLYKGIIEEVLEGIEERGDDSVADDLFNIIVALEALGRPGPLKGGMVPEFAKGLADPTSVEQVHPIVDEILEETYGNMLYQEQIMFILQKLGGFSLGQADMVRRGIASGKRDVIEKQRQPFLDGVEKVQLIKDENTSEPTMEKLIELANHIFDLMAFWSEYGFNKAHSVGYGFLTLRGAWLKANYKTHFMAALISANSKNEERVAKYIEEVRSRGINVLQPKMNRSLKGFTVDGEDILFGLNAIKGLGPKAVDNIIENGPYNNFADFTVKVGGRRTLLPLIKAGFFEEDKRFLLKYWEVIVDIKDGKTKLEESIINQLSTLELTEVTQVEIEKKLENLIYQKSLKKRTEKTRNETLNLINNQEYSHIDLLNLEKETLGMFLSESPLDRYKEMIWGHTTLSDEIKKHKMNEEFFIIGIVVETPPLRIDKNKNHMAFLKIQLLDGVIEIPVFASQYEVNKNKLIEGEILICKAKKIRGGAMLLRAADLIEKEDEFKQFFGIE